MSKAPLQVFSVADAQYQALLPTLREVARAEDTRRLARALALAQGFSFHLATCENPLVAQALILCLAREVPALSGAFPPMVMLAPSREANSPLVPSTLAEQVFDGLLGSEASAVPQITFLDATDSRSDDLDAWLWLFQRLNERRNHLYASGHPLVFLLPPSLTVELMRFAPDLWSIRSSSVRLRGAPGLVETRSLELPNSSSRGIPSSALSAMRAKVDHFLGSSGPQGLRALTVEFRRHAGALHERGETALALKILRDEIWPRVEHARPTALKTELMTELVEVLVRLEQGDEAERLAREMVLPHLAAHHQTGTRVMVLARLADAHRFSGDSTRSSERLLEEALPLAEQLGDDEIRAQVLSRMVGNHLTKRELALAQVLLEEHGALLEQWMPPLEYALMHLQLADTLLATGDPARSMEVLQKRVLPNAQRDARLEALAWHGMARAHRAQGSYEQALHLLGSKALPIYRQLNSVDGQAMAKIAMAELEHEAGDRDDRALRFLRDAEDLLRDNVPDSPRDAARQGALYEELVAALAAMGEASAAQVLLRRALGATHFVGPERARLEAALTRLVSALPPAPDRVIPERRHTCAGPEVYDDDGS